MKKQITPVLLSMFFLGFFVTSYSQPRTDNYCIITFKGNDVKNTLSTYPSFAYFDFSFKPINSRSYILTGYAYDSNNNRLGNSISLDSMSGKPRPLKNIERGHLILDRATMEENDVDGTENYVLTPKKCKDRSGNMVDYVSYRFSNKVANAETGFLSATAVKEFDLNPSPPY